MWKFTKKRDLMLGSAPVISTMPAVDLSRAKAFYTQKLGLKPADVPDSEGALLFEAGDGTRIFLYEREGTKADHTAATFLVENIETVLNGLMDRGVVFEQFDFGEIKTDKNGIAVIGNTKGAWFKDSEGNIIALMSQD
jgi:predicted enzyme related to lactoylglutathione lyase